MYSNALYIPERVNFAIAPSGSRASHVHFLSIVPAASVGITHAAEERERGLLGVSIEARLRTTAT